MMNIRLFFKKVYWHFFKTMPCEMILKSKWAEYRKVEKKYWNNTFDIDSMKVDAACVVPNKSLFVYWDQGFDKSPAIIQKCYRQLIKHVPNGWHIVELTSENLQQYICMPPFVDKMLVEGKMCKANYSDIIRTALLYHYGGAWIDATCLLMNDIPNDVIDTPFFMFYIRDIVPFTPMIFESWFIRSDRHNYVLGRVLENLLCYFKKCKNKKEIYFVWFYILTSLYEHDSKAKRIMNQIPYCSNHDALLVANHYGLDTIYSDKLWGQIKNKCFVQKLTYKYDKFLETNTKENFLKYILQNY